VTREQRLYLGGNGSGRGIGGLRHAGLVTTGNDG
jgi:hypothetical protein